VRDVHCPTDCARSICPVNPAEIQQKIGLEDVVTSNKANLEGMTKGPDSIKMSLSHSLHFSRIIMDEMGTPGATPKPARSNKTGVIEFHMNKPFVYLVVQKELKLILFAGAVRNRERK